MQSLFRKAALRALNVTGYSPEELAYKVLPSFFLELIDRYLRVKTEGLDRIPKEGPCIIVANHSGYMGFDALMLGYEVFRYTGRVPRIIAHKLWFFRPEISVHVKKMGLVPATFDNALKILNKGEILILFPEGEEGNFKPTRFRYRLRRFRRGFVRLALTTGAPILPATIIGAEETHITLSQIRWAEHLFGIIIPVPLNVIPLPVQWKMKFYAPIRLKQNLEQAQNKELVTQLSRKYRKMLQDRLRTQLKKRTTIFMGG